MMAGFSIAQLTRLARLGHACDGKTVVITCGGPSGDYCCGGTHRGRYTVELPNDTESDHPLEHSGVWLIPVSGGHAADSRLNANDYRYSHGGCLFQSAVDAASELASALGFTD